MIYETHSFEETYALGKGFGEKATAGQIFALSGDLGVGKTVFTKGFAKGLGIDDDITSPTFTIVQEYHSGRLPLYHFDAYRIADPDEILEWDYAKVFGILYTDLEERKYETKLNKRIYGRSGSHKFGN